MLISKIGEFGLIERIKKGIKADRSVIKGIGDDCAVLSFDKKHYQLFTCDMIVEGVDFTLKDKPELIGRKAISISISDIAACAGVPKHCVVSLASPKNLRLSYFDSILKGIRQQAEAFKINLVGGDLSSAPKLIIDVSMLGVVEKNKLVLRSTAKEGDVIFTTGALGGSISGKHLNFSPRLKEARYLADNFKINAMIDISDGLVGDLYHILEESHVGAIVFEEALPISSKASSLNDALYSGEDFELLFTLPPNEARKLINKGTKMFKPIGVIISKPSELHLIDKYNKGRRLVPKGFSHFK